MADWSAQILGDSFFVRSSEGYILTAKKPRKFKFPALSPTGESPIKRVSLYYKEKYQKILYCSAPRKCEEERERDRPIIIQVLLLFSTGAMLSVTLHCPLLYQNPLWIVSTIRAIMIEFFMLDKRNLLWKDIVKILSNELLKSKRNEVCLLR